MTQEDNLEKQLNKSWSIVSSLFRHIDKTLFVIIFRDGYKAATKIYSEEDLRKIREMLVQGAFTDMSCSSAVVEFDKIIQSLK
jgi:hypothetical protein